MGRSSKKSKVMVLGTFHMRYTPDLKRIDIDESIVQQRQKEIRKVVESLKEYNPTKIAFEIVKEDNDSLNKEFQQYLDGTFKLGVNEIHQFGFQTAAELNHRQVYAIDWMDTVGNMGLGQVLDWAKEEQPDMYNLIHEYYRPKLQLDIKGNSIHELVRECNSESRIKLDHEMYMAIARIGKGIEYIGMDWLRWWYQRNLTIYKNLAEITNASCDRTLLIIGAAHVHLVSQFLVESGLFEVISPNEYLNKSKG
ncbi:DUF5694 domain-containing protein [Salinibacillus xinjiangensis]|uniref:TraB/GumN family protein n=1 Tax=Salinibacillus xinjiangensis TaxID=1229268 RepID=A0A6G1X5A8_9BACI|nr:DUF5694 domain-containing protein [Salinibacillus xinjiangensis]MRG86086.1 hypothetical protein [Salinibacillus xinjiangensis]